MATGKLQLEVYALETQVTQLSKYHSLHAGYLSVVWHRGTHGHPGVIIIERNVLKWRFDLRYTEGWLDIVTRYNLRIIMICQEGYTNTLAAAALHEIEFLNVSYVVGGFQAWKDEGLPVELESQWVYETPWNLYNKSIIFFVSKAPKPLVRHPEWHIVALGASGSVDPSSIRARVQATTPS